MTKNPKLIELEEKSSNITNKMMFLQFCVIVLVLGSFISTTFVDFVFNIVIICFVVQIMIDSKEEKELTKKIKELDLNHY